MTQLGSLDTLGNCWHRASLRGRKRGGAPSGELRSRAQPSRPRLLLLQILEAKLHVSRLLGVGHCAPATRDNASNRGEGSFGYKPLSGPLFIQSFSRSLNAYGQLDTTKPEEHKVPR